jgi:laminin gamma 1
MRKASCERTYKMNRSGIAAENDEAQPLCTSDFTNMSPLTKGRVVFSTMEGRPGRESAAWKRFTTATDLRVQLTRLNTFGNERYYQEESLQDYYYAISAFEVGGHCLCHGHASECIKEGGDDVNRLKCHCQHHTTGRNCEVCADFFNDAPWREANATDANECKPCECNNRATRCEFDYALYESTGRGGRCLDCTGHTEGQHCERCKRGFYRAGNGECVACHCDPLGSVSDQCTADGQCLCKQGVEGSRCQRCAVDHYEFGVQGCRSCGCSISGSANNTASCDSDSGQCRCKANVHGNRCDTCRLGFFDLQPDHEFGCLSCFCYGHSAECSPSAGFAPTVIESAFLHDTDRWTAVIRSDRAPNRLTSGQSAASVAAHERPVPLQFNSAEELVYVRAGPGEQAYFVAGEQFSGDQRYAYNQWLRFELRIDQEPARASMDDVVIEGANGLTISQSIFGQNNPLPALRVQQFSFKLHEHMDHGWMPTLTAAQFQTLLSNITSFRVRASYTTSGGAFLHDVRLESAVSSGDALESTAIAVPGMSGAGAHWVESCTCPNGYVGQFCEECKPGYRHDPSFGGPNAACVPCECNGHADYCDAESGVCACQNNTAGHSCDRCAAGFYGDALSGQPDACQPCPCPDGGACVQMASNEVACLHCPAGYGGLRCDECIDGFFEARPRFNSSRASNTVAEQPEAPASIAAGLVCSACDCNDNVDSNALGNCDSNSGECLKCVYNTYGAHCEKCLQGYYGNPLSVPKGDCRPCECHVQGTLHAEYQVSGRNYETAFLCDQLTGQCNCKSKVWGRQCDQCMPNHFNISHPDGCQPCECDLIGSSDASCDALTGQCKCRAGVTGLKCDQCLPFHYGFSLKGCSACNCDPVGSLSPSCHANGQCACKPNVEGRHCERCRENRHGIVSGCAECPTCYRLVQEQVLSHRTKIGELEQLLSQIERQPTSLGFGGNRSDRAELTANRSFERQLAEVSKVVSELSVDARNAVGKRAGLPEQLKALRNQTEQLVNDQQSNMFMPTLGEHVHHAKSNMTTTEQMLNRSSKLLTDVRRLLHEDGRRALQAAAEHSRNDRLANSADDKDGEEGDEKNDGAPEPLQQPRKATRLTEMAREARTLSEQHEKQAQQLTEQVQRVVNASASAELAATAALRVQAENQVAVEQLRAQFERAHDTLEKTRRIAEESKAHAVRAYNASLDLRAKASSLTIPGLEKTSSKSHLFV